MRTPHPDERYLLLAQKWLDGTITPQEAIEYANWYNTILDNETLAIPSTHAVDNEAHRKNILQQINAQRIPAIPRYSSVFRKVAAAAVFVLLAGVSYFLFFKKVPSAQVSSITPSVISSDIKSGTNGAILKLANGTMVVLDTTANGAIAYSNANIIKADSTLRFTAGSNSDQVLEWNTLSTPRARQQQLILADGSHVWLNAESSIKFPSVFVGNTRQVEITGEAYFEVAKDAARPFTVKVNDAAIRVLGTHFNVMAYSNEHILKTTLLEGSVRFTKANNSLTLKPNQQSQLSLNDNLRLVEDADVEQAVAWKNGKQVLVGADLETVFHQIERWYDVDVEYTGDLPKRTFTGDIPRTANLSEIVKLFDINKIHARLDAERKKLIVLP